VSGSWDHPSVRDEGAVKSWLYVKRQQAIRGPSTSVPLQPSVPCTKSGEDSLVSKGDAEIACR